VIRDRIREVQLPIGEEFLPSRDILPRWHVRPDTLVELLDQVLVHVDNIRQGVLPRIMDPGGPVREYGGVGFAVNQD
jgi:hypothetical protein